MRFQFPHSGIVCQNQIQITKRFSLLLLAQRSVSICTPDFPIDFDADIRRMC